MPKAKDGKKVSATIPTNEHKRLTEVAEKGQTTVGIIVGTAVLTFLNHLEEHPRALKKLPRDGRRVE